tara:strand:+ start:1355 stop:1579 length:225 start_codon:yes stop_codon:yes gene_type:complete
MATNTTHKAKKIGYKAYSYRGYEIYFIDGIEYANHMDYRTWTIWDEGARYECGGGAKGSADTLKEAKAIINTWN